MRNKKADSVLHFPNPPTLPNKASFVFSVSTDDFDKGCMGICCTDTDGTGTHDKDIVDTHGDTHGDVGMDTHVGIDDTAHDSTAYQNDHCSNADRNGQDDGDCNIDSKNDIDRFDSNSTNDSCVRQHDAALIFGVVRLRPPLLYRPSNRLQQKLLLQVSFLPRCFLYRLSFLWCKFTKLTCQIIVDRLVLFFVEVPSVLRIVYYFNPNIIH